ncbi:hypothetical protein CW705_09265 [Candidatus Bathyarchaeota archaeon]|nr:MAG: hypothetical protein CW705_09265 [Candidatus Bathyarchaeota archaeon]
MYIITGTPGVGKTSISKLLGSKIDAEIISIGELVEKENLHLGWDDKRKTFIADLNAVSKRLKEIIKLGRKNLIIEGHYAVHVVPPEKVAFVFVLRKDPRDLKKILQSRGYHEEKIKENLAAEILDVCLFDAVNIFGEEKVSEIDTTAKSLHEVMKEILSVIKGEKKPKVGIVDWLGMLEAEGELDDYLKDF